MMSYIPDVILKPVAAMTSKCGFNITHQVSQGASNSRWSETPPSLKAGKSLRCISTTSTAEEDFAAESTEGSTSDEIICNRMALLGRAARKAGRHVLVGDRLVLS